MKTKYNSIKNFAAKLAFSGLSASMLLACNGKSDMQQANNSSDSEKPNIIFILSDDLGYGDIGCFGQEKIMTPNIADF